MSKSALLSASPSARRPLVSCVMTTWNGERYIRQAIDSALNQDYEPLEIVVIDDGSSDSTPEICRSYGDRIRYFQCAKCSKGGSTQVVRAYGEAKGEYLAPLDHDDVWLPGKISRQVAALQAVPEAGAVFTRVRVIDEDGVDQGESPLHPVQGNVFHQLLQLNRYFYSSALFRRSILAEVGHHDVDAGVGDWDLWLRIARASPMLAIQEAFTAYRIHSQNYSRDPRRMVESLTRVINNQRQRWHKADCHECARSSRKGLQNVKGAYLQQFHRLSRSGAPLASVVAALKTVLAETPRTALQPRQTMSIAKSIGIALFSLNQRERQAP